VQKSLEKWHLNTSAASVRQKGSRAICAALVIAPLFIPSSPSMATPPKKKVALTIFAASSLSESFDSLGKIFVRENPNVSLKFSYLASSVLASQIEEGAPADAFAAASPRDMSIAGRDVISPRVFASNKIVLAVPKGAKGEVSTVSDLNTPSVKWIPCSPSVACGATTSAALNSLKSVTSKPVSYEPKVASAVSKLLDGEVDAAFIYHTDYVSNRTVLREILFPKAIEASTKYPIGVVRRGQHKIESQRFVNLILSARGQKVLAAAGFGKAS